MKSIKQSLVKQLTALITFILFIVLLFLDISVDTYVDKQFDDALEQKGKSLVNLISYKDNSLQLTMLTDVMTEFSRTENAEYFQIWSNNYLLKYSPNLNQTPEFDFNRTELLLGGHFITQANLPDGESGRVFLFKFKPASDNTATDTQPPIYLVFARSSAMLEQILILRPETFNKLFL